MVSVFWVGACGCFLVPACVCCPVVGGGCGCVVGLGIKCFWRACTLSGSRSTPCERLLPCCWVVVACAASQWLCVVGVGCVWWVVCVVYSGCERFCFVLFFCVLFSFVGHSVDALASRADEGRCGLRYASGSWRASVIIRGCPNGGT